MGRDEVLPVTDASTPPSDETIPADGTTVRLDISGDTGLVFLVGDDA